jgi:hypothetical protein
MGAMTMMLGLLVAVGGYLALSRSFDAGPPTNDFICIGGVMAPQTGDC